MSTLTWIDTTQDGSWLIGIRSAVLLLRADCEVWMRPDSGEGEPYLAVQDIPSSVAGWLEAQGVTLIENTEPVDMAALEALRPPSVAVFGGAGSPYNHASALASLGVTWFYVTGNDIVKGALKQADILLVPGGGWRHGAGQLADLGQAGTEAALAFIEDGGGYLASCAGSLIGMRLPEEAIGYYPPTKSKFTLLEIENWAPLRNAVGCHRSPGIGRVQAQAVSPRHPVALGIPETIDISHYNGPIFAEPQGNVSVVLQFAGTTEGFTPSESFFGKPDRPTDEERSQSLMAEAGEAHLPAIVAGTRGRGRVVLAGLHPEFGLDLDLDQWGRPVQLIANAVLWAAQHGRGGIAIADGEASVAEAESSLDSALNRLRAAAQQLLDMDRKRGDGWQLEETLRASFGCTPRQLWRHALDSLLPLADRIASSWEEARGVATFAREARLAYAAVQVYDPLEGPDLGAQGAVWLVEEATRLIGEASCLIEKGGEGQERAEELISRSYLSAVGVLTNAAQRLESETQTYKAEDDLARLRELIAASQVLTVSR